MALYGPYKALRAFYMGPLYGLIAPLWPYKALRAPYKALMDPFWSLMDNIGPGYSTPEVRYEPVIRV